LKGRQYAVAAVIAAAIMFAGAFTFVATQSGGDVQDVTLGADDGRELYGYEMYVENGVLISLNGMLTGAIIIPLVDENGEDIVAVGDKAFEGQDKMTGIVLSANLVTIGVNAFSGCTAIRNITFGATLEAVKDNAFFDCSSLKNVYLERRDAADGFDSLELKFGKNVFSVPFSITYDFNDSSIFSGWFYRDGTSSKPLPGASVGALDGFSLNEKTVYSLWMDAYYIAFYDGLGAEDEVPVTGSEPVVMGREFNPFALFIEYGGNYAREGYSLIGWRADGGSTVYNSENPFTMPARAVNFTAAWEPVPEPPDNSYATSALTIGVLAIGLLFAMMITGKK
jgi:hypothetical protein